MGGGGGTERYDWLDGVKGLLIFLVVLGHLIRGKTSSSEGIYGLVHYLIYSVHMPMFIFISGLLSKKNTSFKNIFMNLICPYIAVNLVVNTFRLVLHRYSRLDLITPYEITWYILTLATYRTFFAAKYIRINRIFLPVSIIGSFLFSFVQSDTWYIMSVGRTLLLYPIFYLGQIIDIKKLNILRKKKILSIVIFITVIAIELVLLKQKIVDIKWATHDYANAVSLVGIKYVYFIFAIGLFVSFSALPFKKMNLVIRWGKNSMCIYLFHIFVCHLVSIGIPKFTNQMLPIVFILGFGITELLSLDLLNEKYNKAIKKITGLLFKWI